MACCISVRVFSTLASAASLMIALDSLVVTTALPTIRHDLGASVEQLEWTKLPPEAPSHHPIDVVGRI